jgi:hypothetical protein
MTILPIAAAMPARTAPGIAHKTMEPLAIPEKES